MKLSAYQPDELLDCGILGEHQPTVYYTFDSRVEFGRRRYTIAIHNVLVLVANGLSSVVFIVTDKMSELTLKRYEDEIAASLERAYMEVGS